VAMTKPEALEAILAHHRELDEQARQRAGAVREAVKAGRPHGRAAAELVAYLGEEVLPHALAEEHTLYPAAGGAGVASALLSEMRAEHRSLASLAEGLAGAEDGAGALARAEEIAAGFSAHVAKENELVLPALRSAPDVDLAEVLVQMHRLSEAAREADESTFPHRGSTDPEAELLFLLLEAAKELALGGQADRACRLAASAWAAVRVARPELAVRVTSLLHTLAGSLKGTSPAPSARHDHEITEPDLDVRELTPARRHSVIFTAYDALAPGAGFVLVNDHDPKPLRYQLEAEHPDEFTWEYIESGPRVWRVRLGRAPLGLAP
jgi:uncharacterized protein (DUF2249 family)/iron-sulfur cluster repair protein YtfE (RIC family)